jgi:hypothetical protein
MCDFEYTEKDSKAPSKTGEPEIPLIQIGND